MKHTRNFLLRLLSLVLLAIPFSEAGAADKYKVDPDHTSLLFRALHFGVGHVYGQFAEVSGEFVIDTADPKKSTVQFEAKTASLTTHNAKRDQHLKSPDFLDAKQFPVIRFESTAVSRIDDKTASVRGKLSLHGVSKEITVTMKKIGQGPDPWGNARIGAEGSFVVKRSDYGIQFMPEGIGDEIHLILAVEGILQKG